MRKNIQEWTKCNLHKTAPKNSNIVGNIACLKRRYHLHFKGCLSQILVGPFLNTLSLARFSPLFITNYVRTATSVISAVSNSFIDMSALLSGAGEKCGSLYSMQWYKYGNFQREFKASVARLPEKFFLPVFLLNKLLCRLISSEIYYLRFIS